MEFQASPFKNPKWRKVRGRVNKTSRYKTYVSAASLTKICVLKEAPPIWKQWMRHQGRLYYQLPTWKRHIVLKQWVFQDTSRLSMACLAENPTTRFQRMRIKASSNTLLAQLKETHLLPHITSLCRGRQTMVLSEQELSARHSPTRPKSIRSRCHPALSMTLCLSASCFLGRWSKFLIQDICF